MSDFAEERARSRQLMEAYSNDPDFIERAYEVPPLEELLESSGVVGVARYIELYSFSSERIHTFAYTEDTIVVTTVIGATSLWSSIPQFLHVNHAPEATRFDGKPFDPSASDIRSKTLEISAIRCPPLIASWEDLKAAAIQAPSCQPPEDICVNDGVSYRNRIFDSHTSLYAEWSNPGYGNDQQQLELIDAYRGLLACADLFREERLADIRRREKNRATRAVRRKRKQKRSRRRN